MLLWKCLLCVCSHQLCIKGFVCYCHNKGDGVLDHSTPDLMHLAYFQVVFFVVVVFVVVVFYLVDTLTKMVCATSTIYIFVICHSPLV